jgi:hypothetical protein
LVDSVKEWHSEWFYTGNMNPPLVVHSSAGPVINDRWEKLPLTIEELNKIKPLFERIKSPKQQGLTGFGIVTSYLCRQVQPLKVRENYGFEYSGAEDPSRIVPALELTEEVLECLKKILKGVTVVPHRVDEYCDDNPPLAVSCFCYFFTSSFLLCFFCSTLPFGYL